MAHRFNHLAKKYVAPLWECVQSAIIDLKEWLAAGTEEARRIARALRNAEDMARDALIRMAQELMVFPAKPRAASERFAIVPIPPKVETRSAVFRLGLEALEDSVGWIERSDIHQADWRHATSSVDCASHNSPYTPIEIFERRMAALEDVLASPGPHAARMRRALYKRETEIPQPITLKESDTVLLDHIGRVMDEPAYYDTGEFARLHKLILESG